MNLTSFYLQQGAKSWPSFILLKYSFKCVRDSILSLKEESFIEKREVGNQVLDEVNKKVQIALQNRDLATVSVAQAMTELAYKR